MIVLSLFNGMSTGHTALDNVGIKVDKYYSSEIKPAAIKLTQHHYPDTIQLGDVTKWKEWDIDWKSVDMVLSGSPPKSQKSLIHRDNTTGMISLINQHGKVRTVNKIEMCRLQGFPDDWCDILTKNQAGSLLGDGWTLPIIEHIFGYIKENK